MSSVLGAGVKLSNIMGLASKFIPHIAGAINGAMGSHLPTSVLDVGKVGETMKNFTANQSKLALKKKSMKSAVEPASKEQLDSVIKKATDVFKG